MKLKAIFKILGYVIMMCVASCNYTNEVEDPGDNVVTSSKNTGTSSHYEAHNRNTKFHNNDSTPISIDSTHNYTVEIYKNKELVTKFIGFKTKEEIEEILKEYK